MSVCRQFKGSDIDVYVNESRLGSLIELKLKTNNKLDYVVESDHRIITQEPWYSEITIVHHVPVGPYPVTFLGSDAHYSITVSLPYEIDICFVSCKVKSCEQVFTSTDRIETVVLYGKYYYEED